MAQAQTFLCAAANVEVPAYVVLAQKAYTVTAPGDDAWYAEKDGLRMRAENLIDVLGIVSIYEARGPNWAAADPEIDDFLTKYEH